MSFKSGVGEQPDVLTCVCVSARPSSICWKDSSSPVTRSRQPCCNPIDHGRWVYFWNPSSVMWATSLSLRWGHTVSYLAASHWASEWGSVSPLPWFLLFQGDFDGSLLFTWTEDQLSVSAKELARTLKGIALHLWVPLGGSAALILSILIHGHRRSLHLLPYSLIFINHVL